MTTQDRKWRDCQSKTLNSVRKLWPRHRAVPQAGCRELRADTETQNQAVDFIRSDPELRRAVAAFVEAANRDEAIVARVAPAV